MSIHCNRVCPCAMAEYEFGVPNFAMASVVVETPGASSLKR